MSLFHQVMIGSGVCWTITYILILRRGVLDLTYGMPAAALFANLAWELNYSFISPHTMPQLAVDRIWFALDILLMLQFLRFGPAVRKVRINISFYLEVLLSFAVTFTLIRLLNTALNDANGAYVAFGQNLMMSVLFIGMLRDRKSVSGQSIYIAFFKFAGTLLASTAFYFQTKTYSQSPLMQFLFLAILVYDIIYIILLAIQLKRQRYKVFKRF